MQTVALLTEQRHNGSLEDTATPDTPCHPPHMLHSRDRFGSKCGEQGHQRKKLGIRIFGVADQAFGGPECTGVRGASDMAASECLHCQHHATTMPKLTLKSSLLLSPLFCADQPCPSPVQQLHADQFVVVDTDGWLLVMLRSIHLLTLSPILGTCAKPRFYPLTHTLRQTEYKL